MIQLKMYSSTGSNISIFDNAIKSLGQMYCNSYNITM
jgi:hypothetical protein